MRNLCRAELFPRRSPRDDLLALRVPTDPALTVGLSYRRNQMAEQHSPIIEFPRKYIGRRVGDPPRDEAEHFYRCPACGRWVDCRDLSQVFDHEGPPTASSRRLAPTKFNRALTGQPPAAAFKRPPHACGVVSNCCCDVSAPRGTVFNPSAAPLPPPKPAMACTSWDA